MNWGKTVELEIAHREEQGVEVLDLKGNLTFGAGDLAFRNELAALLQAGKVRVALNLKDLAELDTIGLGTLVWAVESLQKEGGNLAIFNLHPAHSALLEEAKLETVLTPCKTEQDAIEVFFPGSGGKHYDILEFVEAHNFKEKQ